MSSTSQVTTVKTCPGCRETKAHTEFYVQRRSPTGVQSWCKMCANSYRSLKYKEGKYRYPATPEETRKRNYRKNFGIPVEKYDELFIKQNGCCAICGTDKMPGHMKNLAIDHEHETGIVRGLLCISCNAGLGNFKDSPELLAMASVYLEYPR